MIIYWTSCILQDQIEQLTLLLNNELIKRRLFPTKKRDGSHCDLFI